MARGPSNESQIAEKLGELTEAARTGAREREQLFKVVHSMDEKLDGKFEVIAAKFGEIDRKLDRLPALDQRMGKVETIADDYRIKRAQVGVLGMAAGAVAGFIAANVKSIMGLFSK